MVGLVTIVVAVALVFGALNFSKLPVFGGGTTYQADFANAGGLAAGDIVTVAGVKVGQVTGLALDGDRVQVSFTVPPSLALGADTTAAAKVLNPVGEEYLELAPAGPGQLSPARAIPTARTSVPSTLVGDLSQLTAQAERYDIGRLVRSLRVGTQDLQGTPPSVTAAALSGLARFSEILAAHQQDLSTLVVQGSRLAAVLSGRSQELVSLVGQSNLVLQVLNQRRQEIQALLTSTATLSTQLTTLFSTDGAQFGSLLTNLATVSAVLAKDSTTLGTAIPLLAAFNRYAANVTGSGPYADVVVPTMLLPDNIIKQCAQQLPINTTLGCQQ